MAYKSKTEQREYQKAWAKRKRAKEERETVLLLLQAGVSPATIGTGATLRRQLGQAKRDKKALEAHLGWHHEALKEPDLATRLERLEGHVQAVSLALSRHEVEHVVKEAPWESMPPVGYDEEELYRQHPIEHTLREGP